MTQTNESDISGRHTRMLRGEGHFVGDLRPAGALQMAVVRSPVASGALRGVDTSRAAALPGVAAVLTAADLATVPLIPLRSTHEPELMRRRQPIIAIDRVRFVGEPLAIVVAQSRALAEDAADAITVDISPTPPILRPQSAPWDDGDSNTLIVLRTAPVSAAAPDRDAGDVCVVTAEFVVGRQTGVPMETRGIVARWSPEDDRLEIWGATKYLHVTRRALADCFGIAAEGVVCHGCDVGGMFGVRGELYPEDFLTAWAARVTRSPVEWIEDRDEHFLSINHSRDQRHRVELVVGADGSFRSLHDEVVHDFGAYPRPIGSRLLRQSLAYLPGPYRWGAVSGTARGVLTNKPPVGSMRAPCASEVAFARERAIDMAAARLGADPIRLRLRNLVGPDDLPHVSELGGDAGDVVYDAGDFPAVFRDVLDRVGYEDLRDSLARRRAKGQIVGVGVGAFMEGTGAGLTESVDLALRADGTLLLGTTGCEFGQGLDRMAQAVVAQSLGRDLVDVQVWSGDSQAHHAGNGTYGSRSTIFVGSASLDAAQTMRAEAHRLAAERLGMPVEDVIVTGDGFRHGAATVAWKELAPLAVTGEHHMARSTWGFGMHLAVVCVDEATGGIRVERLVVAYDCGRAIDLGGVADQLVGGSIFGLGGALWEELRYDSAGTPVGTGLGDYHLPRCADVPTVEDLIYQTGSAPGNPLGARGVGEAGVVGVAAAVTNALADALETPGWPTRLPVSPQMAWTMRHGGRR